MSARPLAQVQESLGLRHIPDPVQMEALAADMANAYPDVAALLRDLVRGAG
jgi:hypothetical protein